MMKSPTRKLLFSALVLALAAGAAIAATLTACLTLAGFLRAPLVGLTIQPDIDFAFQWRFNQLTGFVSELAA